VVLGMVLGTEQGQDKQDPRLNSASEWQLLPPASENPSSFHRRGPNKHSSNIVKI
jgi:hypothetical protein